MNATRIAFAALLVVVTALPAAAQPSARGIGPVGPARYSNVRPADLRYAYSFGFGSDYYSGNYYRPTPDRGYYYLGVYYPEFAGVVGRTPLSAPPPGLVPTPNLASPSAFSPGYTFPDLINPASNPTILPKR